MAVDSWGFRIDEGKKGGTDIGRTWKILLELSEGYDAHLRRTWYCGGSRA